MGVDIATATRAANLAGFTRQTDMAVCNLSCVQNVMERGHCQ